jgi:hypothetical protein
MLGGRNQGPQLPGMENLGADAVIRGGIDTATGIPAVCSRRHASITEISHHCRVELYPVMFWDLGSTGRK